MGQVAAALLAAPRVQPPTTRDDPANRHSAIPPRACHLGQKVLFISGFNFSLVALRNEFFNSAIRADS